MAHADDAVRLRYMLDHAREAVAMALGRSRADLDADRQLNLAMTRLLEIIGEAAARVTSEAVSGQLSSFSDQPENKKAIRSG
jgi:uncharacterized protein with HEPN domain